MCCSGEEVEKEACFTLGLLAIKQEHQHAIADQASRSLRCISVMHGRRHASCTASTGMH